VLELLADLIPLLYVAAVTPALIVIDVRDHRLPNRLVVPGIAVGLAAAAFGWSPVPVVAGLAYGGFLWLLALGGGIGMGDVKLAVLLGLASPAAGIAIGAALAAFVLGGVTASIALVRRGRRTRIAFGPSMLGGYWVAVLLAMLSGSIAGVP
jgi:leader peptidase (prepilin peptidase)/N-methyltransferase